MSDQPGIPVLDHELAEDELAWMKAVYRDFAEIRASFSDRFPGRLPGRETAFNPREALREVLGRDEHRLSNPPDLSGPGPWRLGQNRHGRGWNCTGTQEAGPTSFPCMSSARRTGFPSARTGSLS